MAMAMVILTPLMAAIGGKKSWAQFCVQLFFLRNMVNHFLGNVRSCHFPSFYKDKINVLIDGTIP